VHRSIRPELQALASACDNAAEETASRNAVSLKPEGKLKAILMNQNFCLTLKMQDFKGT
jgi:hypothetical protein